MSELVLRPRSATELLDAAFQVYRRSPVPFMVAAALIYVPWLAIQLIFSLRVPQTAGDIGAGIVRVVLITAIAGVLIFALEGGVIALLARAAYLDETIDVADAFRQTLSRFAQLLVATIIQFALIGIGFMFIFVPGVYLLARFFSVRQVVVLEDVGPLAALGRSGVLSKGHKLHILGTIILVALLTVVAQIGAGMLINLQPSTVVSTVLLTAVVIVVAPLFGITETLLYFDMRIRNEGFDVEYLANAPTGGAAATGITA